MNGAADQGTIRGVSCLNLYTDHAWDPFQRHCSRCGIPMAAGELSGELASDCDTAGAEPGRPDGVIVTQRAPARTRTIVKTRALGPSTIEPAATDSEEV